MAAVITVPTIMLEKTRGRDLYLSVWERVAVEGGFP